MDIAILEAMVEDEDDDTSALRATLTSELTEEIQYMKYVHARYAWNMKALGWEARPEPTVREWMDLDDEGKKMYHRIPPMPNNAHFPKLEDEEWESAHSDSDGEFGDENGDEGLSQKQREVKAEVFQYLAMDVNGLSKMYSKKITELKKLTREAVHAHRAALCIRKGADQEMIMKTRSDAYMAFLNSDMAPEWTEDEFWTGFPMRLKKKDGLWVELGSDEERGSEDELSDSE